MQPITKILVKNLIFTLIIAVVSFFLFKTVFSANYLSVYWLILIGMSVLTALIHFLLIKLSTQSHSKFSSRFILITGIKMIFYLFFIISYSFLNPKQAVSFLVSFMVLYIAYTAFEVIIILPFFKHQNRQQ